jgi:uncharacterized membrane protein YbhN (UPF0104 family)
MAEARRAVTGASAWAWASLEAVAGQFADVSLGALGIGLTLHTLKLAARARGWQNVLRAAFPRQCIRYRDAAAPYFAGVGVGAVIPLGGGQALRVVLARARLHGASSATLLGSLAVERALDLMVAIAIVPFALVGGLGPGVGFTGSSPVASLREHMLAVVAVAITTTLVLTCLAGLLRQRLAPLLHRFVHGLRALRSPRQYTTCVASWQLLSWALRLAALYWFLRAFHIPGGVATALLVLVLQLLASLLPLTPGGAGSQQALIVLALAGSASGAALVGFSAGSQAATIVLDLLLGALALVVSGGSLRIRKLILVTRSATA